MPLLPRGTRPCGTTSASLHLPFADPDRIVWIGIRSVAGQPGRIDNVSFPDFKDLQASARLFDGIGAADEDPMDLADETRAAERFVGAYVSANAFGLIGHQAAFGRDFTEEDDQMGVEPVVILGHTVWQRRYGGDPGIVGRRVRVNGVLSTVVGIMPRGLRVSEPVRAVAAAVAPAGRGAGPAR